MDVNQSKQDGSVRDVDRYPTEVEEGVDIEIISLEQNNPTAATDKDVIDEDGIISMEIGSSGNSFALNQLGGGERVGRDRDSRLCDSTSSMEHGDVNNNPMDHLDMDSTAGNHFDFDLEDDLRERMSSVESVYDDLLKNSTRPSSSISYVVGGELNIDDRDECEFDDELRSDDGYTISSLTPLQRFQKAGRQVKFMCGVQLSLNKCAEEAGKGTFSIQIADLLEKMSRTPSVVYIPENSKEKLSFNATDYRSKYEFTWPEKAKEILLKAPSERTPDDIRLVRSLMRGLYSFRKYSTNLQDLICKVIRYAKYGRRRVVIRKGHPGFSFYFIFSGMAGVTLEEDEVNAFVKKEVNILKKGASFGEIALLKDSRRKATVVCLKDTEFLVVDSDDFFDNNLHLHIQQDFEYRLNFISRLDLFSTWSSETIEEISDMGRIEEYCNESLIVKDARDTEWLFIVTKGRADVLKLVDLAQLYLSKQAEEEEVMEVSRKARVLSGRSAVGWNEDFSSKLSKIPQHQQYHQNQQPNSDPRFPWMTGDDGQRQPQKNGKKSDVPSRPKTTGQIASRTRNPVPSDVQDDMQGIRRSKSATVRLKIPSDKLGGNGDEAADEDQPHDIHKSNSRVSSANHRRTLSEPVEDMSTLPGHITLGLETIKAPGVEAGVYIQVDALRPGDFFGIQGIRSEMPHLSLVSHGCELIRISMSKFREFADDETLAKVTKLLPTYASDLALWRSFQKQNKWRNFKNGVITDVMRHAHQSGPATIIDSRARPKSRRSVTSDWVTNTWSRRSSMGGESTGARNTPLPKIITSAVERGNSARSPRIRQRGKSDVSNAGTSRPGSRALTCSRPPSTRVSDSRPPTRHSMSNHDLRILENRRLSLPASRFVSASQSMNSQPMTRTLSAVGGAMSVGGENKFHSQASMPHLNIPDLASFTKPTFTSSRSWKELKS
ncbi:uncharacterized protein LOC129257139 [Lytechinus pictus]|uniref:uncharacterized protein LOC129257139 n=1 Tax=Lytechinus pictus TaxID=7653 RepID=UPI0030BA0E46